ncbi:YdcF family protein, partial [Candidatus Wolfebacteria bacterium CG03_land_8_20_14_0_80_36_15]
MDNLNIYDAIIVLGNSTRGEEIGGIMKNRLEKALEIYGKNQKTKIILSGGKEEKGISEAQKMRRYLEKWGLTEEIFILEEQSRNTFENLKNS